ncbi:hypothetical protein D1AOALGA4SA_968 [Olavius algarvensis Delta 1 endosymbiont]|nr:hypothetical protein D1AOALGA4SA_968 [Olavius algarvensis Delta 1 endosymbiont]
MKIEDCLTNVECRISNVEVMYSVYFKKTAGRNSVFAARYF